MTCLLAGTIYRRDFMKRIAIGFSAFVLSAAIASAADDPIAVRKALMDGNAAAAGAAGAMIKGELDYSPVVAKAAIAQFRATAMAVGDFFPEGSDKGDTTAAPAIWENRPAFEEALSKFLADANAAMEASGKEGPADLDAFKAAVVPVLNNCRSCHEDFRIKQN